MKALHTILAVAIAAGLLISWRLVAGAESTSKTTASPALIAHGQYLAQAADCDACHTAPGSAPFAGGLSLQTDFGTIYTTNLTPDADDGIGHWTSDDFWHAIHDGVARGGRHLYPAMPYTSYRGMTRPDSDAIYAYLMHLQPVHLANRETELRFPYDMRLGMVAWNALFAKNEIPSASTGSSADWERGRYLVDALGHCGECHTPRGSFGQLELSHPLAGYALGRYTAPDITPAGLVARGWTQDGLMTFLGSGLAPQSSAFGDMHPVIALSTRHLDAADLRATATYLLGDRPPSSPSPAPPPLTDTVTAALAPGRSVYVGLCAGCHGLDGDGKPHTVVALKENTMLQLVDPRDLIVTVANGIGAQDFPGLESMPAMPPFADKLSDQQIAELANYLRATWGKQAAEVTADTVHHLR